jgi:hypothetical protein
MKKGISSIVTAALLAGCAGPQMRLADEDRRGLAGAPRVHVVHQPALRIFTVEGRAHNAALLFGIVGVMASVGHSMSVQQELKPEDPVLRVKQRMASVLAGELGVRGVNVVEEPIASDQPDDLRMKLQGGLVLDARTIAWGLHNDRARYEGRARLLRLDDSTLLWQANCEHILDEDKESPTREALMANGGALLKANLAKAADRCADALAASLIGKTGR